MMLLEGLQLPESGSSGAMEINHKDLYQDHQCLQSVVKPDDVEG